MPFFIVPKEGLWGVGIKRPTSDGIKIATSHSFTVGWDATLIRVKKIDVLVNCNTHLLLIRHAESYTSNRDKSYGLKPPINHQ